MKKIETAATVATLAAQVGAVLHADWQASFAAANGADAPRIKTTKDQTWVAVNGTDQVDIAHTSYRDLPEDWKGENQAAGTVVARLVLGTDAHTPEWMEEAASIVHDEWVSRNPWADKALLVSYDELPEAEKEKDRAQLRLALRLLNA